MLQHRQERTEATLENLEHIFLDMEEYRKKARVWLNKLDQDAFEAGYQLGCSTHLPIADSPSGGDYAR